MFFRKICYLFIFAFFVSYNIYSNSQDVSVSEAKEEFLKHLNQAQKDAKNAKTHDERVKFAQKWLTHFDMKEMARQALASVILDRIDQNDGNIEQSEKEIMKIFDRFLEKFSKRLTDQYSSEQRVKTFSNMNFSVISSEQIDSETVQLKVLFKPKETENAQEFSIVFDIIKKNSKVLIAWLSVEGSFDPIRNEREQVKSVYNENGNNLESMLKAY